MGGKLSTVIEPTWTQGQNMQTPHRVIIIRITAKVFYMGATETSGVDSSTHNASYQRTLWDSHMVNLLVTHIYSQIPSYLQANEFAATKNLSSWCKLSFKYKVSRV